MPLGVDLGLPDWLDRGADAALTGGGSEVINQLPEAAQRGIYAAGTGGLTEFGGAGTLLNPPPGLTGPDLEAWLKKAADAVGVSNTDTTQLDEDRKRALDAYNAREAERSAYQGPNVRSVAPGTVRAPTINDRQAQEIRTRQLSALTNLEDAAAGRVPSVAELQLRKQAARTASTMTGLAAGARGTQGIAARRAALRGIQQGTAQANADAAIARAGEMAQARGQLTGALEGTRGADWQRAALAAGQGLDVNKTNVANALEAQRANQGADIQKEQVRNQYRTSLGGEAAGASKEAGAYTGTALETQLADKKRRADLVNNLAQGGVSIGKMFSDMRLKEDVQPEPAMDKEAFLKSLEDAISYKYTDKDLGEGTQHGQSAQNLESGSEIGKDIVKRKGKKGMRQVDIGKMVMAMSEALGHLNQKVDNLAGAR